MPPCLTAIPPFLDLRAGARLAFEVSAFAVSGLGHVDIRQST